MDQTFLNSLSHLDREKVLEERHKNRQILLKRNALRENQDMMADDITDFDNLLTKRLGKLKDDNDAYENNHNLFQLTTESYLDKKKQKKVAVGDLSINPTEDLVQLNSICLKRDLAFKLQNHLYFEECVTRCLVKVHYQAQSGRVEYRIGVITGVKVDDNQKYAYEGQNYNKLLIVLMNEGLICDIKLINISNKEIDEQEAFGLLSQLKGIMPYELNMKWIKEKQADLNKYLNYQFTGEDVIKIAEKQIQNLSEVTEIDFLRKKKFYENKLNMLKDLNFHDQDETRQLEINRLSEQVREINDILRRFSEQQTREKREEKFLNFNKVSLVDPQGRKKGL